jgi:hypothetical protein
VNFNLRLAQPTPGARQRLVEVGAVAGFGRCRFAPAPPNVRTCSEIEVRPPRQQLTVAVRMNVGALSIRPRRTAGY